MLSVLMARRAIERAEVCLVLLDSFEGLTAQDTHVAGYVNEAGRGVVVVVNKADLVAGEEKEARKRLRSRSSSASSSSRTPQRCSCRP